ncbi:MAG: glycosyltransferase family 39 protein, partial [Deltaproteobacteria bacterium]
MDKSLILIGRSASVLFGCATIIVVYLIGKELFNKKVGLIASLFLTLNYLHISLSGVMKPDAVGIFWVMLTFLYAVKIMKKGLWKDYIYCAIIMGIAGSTKYYVVLLPAIIAHFIYIYNLTGKDKWFYQALKDRKMILLFIGFTVFIITSPYIVLDYKTLLDQLIKHYLMGQVSSIYRISTEYWLYKRFIYQLFITYPLMFGIPLFFLSIIGTSLLVAKDGRKALLLLSYPVNFFFFAASIT